MRIVGYDLARALAIFGMIWVHFRIVMQVEKAGPEWLIWFGKIFEGRASVQPLLLLLYVLLLAKNFPILFYLLL